MKHNPKSYLILLVEDEPLSRAVLGRQLEKSGYRVNAVASAEEAIDELKKGLPAIVLLDIKLPGMSGLELLEWLRREYRTRRLPVIMISALSETGDIVRGLEMKANDYVAKPINMPILLARIGTQLTISDMIIRLETQSKILARMASLDELTGVFNRRSLIEILKIEVERSIRYTTPLSVLMVDIDFFKRVNDDHGHAVGDDILRRITRRIAGVLRSSDILCRFGGEEFFVILPHTDTIRGAEAAERIRRIIEERPFESGDSELSLTISVGVASLDPGADNPGEKLMAAADAALYRAKDEGRNRVCVKSEESGMRKR